MKILFLSANPDGTAKLHLDNEFSQIEEGLQRSKLRDQFQLVSKWAVNSNSLRRALLEENPDIVHYSGHGEGQAGLVLVGQDGQPKPATAEALSGLFEQFPNIKCVLLNACYAQVQAKAIVEHIDYVIGMKQAVRDDAAIAFATGFYDGLGYNKSVDVAFALGCNAVQFELASFSSTTRSRKAIPVDFEKVEPLPDYLIPVLLKKETGSIGSLTSPTPSSSEANSLSEKLQPKDDTIRADALKIYRERVQEFLADLKLTQIEKFQLAILANVLGVSEADANRILQEEQERPQYNTQPSVTNRQSQFTRIGNVKNYLFVCGAALLIVSIKFAIDTNSNSSEAYIYKNGDNNRAFVHVSNINWEEVDCRGKTISTFDETARDLKSITLYDKTRDMTIKLPVAGGQSSITSGSLKYLDAPFYFVEKKPLQEFKKACPHAQSS